MRPFDKYPDEHALLEDLARDAALSPADRAQITAQAASLVQSIRDSSRPGLMEVFLAEYGLSTDEGIALMCLAESLLRVPDPETIDALIEDKIAPSDWGRHLGQSSSSLVNASTWALLLTGRVLDDDAPGVTGVLRGAIKRLGEPVIRAAARQAMREMGQQFVLGEDMAAAMNRAAGMEAKGYTYSYDMLGEAALTDADAMRYHTAYAKAIAALAKGATGDRMRDRPGISVKLSAIHPRYDEASKDRAVAEIVPRLADLAKAAAKADLGLNIDAEEADRLELSLDVFEAVLALPGLSDWEGLGLVVQAYGLRAKPVLDHVYDLARQHQRRFTLRLVKGAYWDTEIKHAQVLGMPRFPVFTTKPATDVSYLANARRLLSMTDRIYPQFATHNAHTVAAIAHMSSDTQSFEFQRLHGMGEQLHGIVKGKYGTGCRIYAPVGAHRDLLAYLVRRLLENGANSSFVNQVVDTDVPPEIVAADPFEHLDRPARIRSGSNLFLPERANSKGWDLTDRTALDAFEAGLSGLKTATWQAAPLLANSGSDGPRKNVRNPFQPSDIAGAVALSTDAQIDTALDAARAWAIPADERKSVLWRAADLYEDKADEFFAILAREAGKTPLDAIGEVREAVDFLRYYGALADRTTAPLGTISCISPWNFPLAIFTGQIAGALSAGCAVLAKPAEQTPLVAWKAVTLLHEAGVPRDVLQYLPGDGPTVGRALTSDPRVAGVAFTGSTETAQIIRRAMADTLPVSAPLLAETGGLNAMIVDSTALLEQAVSDVLMSAFQSAGQRCSALRCLYVQHDIAKDFKKMLFGAMDELKLGDPWDVATDVGPVIDAEARDDIQTYLASARVVKQLPFPKDGFFVPPTVVKVAGIAEMKREIFGPVLHLATYQAHQLDQVIAEINNAGYGLTFGLHTRIDSRVQEIVEQVAVGNTYVNRNQIGAVVGSQPFGGEGMSGTGPKAGGPAYPLRFCTSGDVYADERDMPGPTGETNRLTRLSREAFLCLGPGADQIAKQIEAIEAAGGTAQGADGLNAEALCEAQGIAGAVWWGDDATARSYLRALAGREGPILPLITGQPRRFEVTFERHLCVDTTASGGNAELLAEVARA
ncbi:MAG: bifunctional proline dehydrogenase/L-glutamate gamma-semialdehyde dehydrogenase PutA [Silicimonas sp.]|nr:bifunctional proline dehydrogenase/L-glutamate gamma-semialdehyde dehydrogenase PutA [Silicimonas sp.]